MGQRERKGSSQLCPTLCNPMGCLPGSSIHGILQARILEWMAISFSRGSSHPRDLNPGLPHCRQTLYHLSHQGSCGWVHIYTPLEYILEYTLEYVYIPLEFLSKTHAGGAVVPLETATENAPKDFPGGPVVKTPHNQCRKPGISKLDPPYHNSDPGK